MNSAGPNAAMSGSAAEPPMRMKTAASGLPPGMRLCDIIATDAPSIDRAAAPDDQARLAPLMLIVSTNIPIPDRSSRQIGYRRTSGKT